MVSRRFGLIIRIKSPNRWLIVTRLRNFPRIVAHKNVKGVSVAPNVGERARSSLRRIVQRQTVRMAFARGADKLEGGFLTFLTRGYQSYQTKPRQSGIKGPKIPPNLA